jgi:hypothetical protein
MRLLSQVELVPVEQLELDIQNPRIRKWIEMYGDQPTPEQLYLALGAGSADPESGSTTTFNSLKQSIQTNKGIIQPIIVNKSSDDRLVVIEGNTRVAIYRDFKANGVAGDWNLIPAIVHDDLGKRGVDAIRLQAHLVGPRPWDPYSKAKYLHGLRDVEDLPLSEIIDFCGGKKKEIIEYIDAYIDMEKYYRPVTADDSAFDTTRFSAFVELQKSGIKEAILTSGFTLNDFAKWVDERLIDPLNTVRAIPQILANPIARKEFLKSGAKEAKKLLDSPAPASTNDLSLEQLLQAVINRVNHIQYHVVKRMRANPSSDTSQLVMEAFDVIADLQNEINKED